MHFLSKLAIILGSVLDAHSNWQGPESNRLYGQRFTTQDASLKFALVGGLLVAEHFYVKRRPRSRSYVTLGNFAFAGATVGVAVRNYRLPRK